MRHPVFQNRHVIGLFILMILQATICGCGNGATVTGKVMYKDRPVTYGSIIFLKDKTARSGFIEPDGSYTVEDVPAGTVKIAVISRNPSKGRSVLRGQKPVPPGKKGTASAKTASNQWFPLPAKFEDPKTSGLGCTIDSGSVVYDIQLK
jgi:hypothetical protein